MKVGAWWHRSLTDPEPTEHIDPKRMKELEGHLMTRLIDQQGTSFHAQPKADIARHKLLFWAAYFVALGLSIALIWWKLL